MKNLYLTVLVFAFAQTVEAQTFNCGDTLIDPRDGKRYATVLIGSDCWFSQNLNYGNVVQSDTLSIIHSQQTNNGIPEKYAQNNDTNNLPAYGGLYEQAELMNYSTSLQGLCPAGWHVSTDAEWQNLITTSGGIMFSATAGHGGNALKKLGEGFGAGTGTDAVGFAAVHGGDRDGFGIFYGLGLRAIYWTSTSAGPNQAYQYTMWATNDTIQRLPLGVMTTGFSCRCVKDNTSGVGESNSASSITIYPNPAIGSFSINNLSAGNIITVADISGRIVYSAAQTQSGVATISTDNWAKGFYTVQVNDPQSGLVTSEKLIVQ
ncbi:MAG: hypothetical protein RL007_466 [Bacteroidota bacterium]|jgi:uncharacterized protein (TIGR02145 family)